MASVDQIQGLSGTLAIKPPCRVATTAAITLSGEQTIDGVAVVADDRVLVKDQSTASENGIWIADTSAWSRALDFDGSNDVVDGTLVYVANGTTNADLVFRCTGTNPITPGTTSITFTGSVTFTTMSAFFTTLMDDANAAAARATLAAVGLTGDETVAGNKTFSGNNIQTGTLTMGGKSFIEAEGAAVASAASCNIWATDGNTCHITGTTQIDDFATAPQAGAWKKIIFDDALILNQSANLNLNGGGADITTAAGDVAFVYADTTTQMDVFVVRKSGASTVAPYDKIVQVLEATPYTTYNNTAVVIPEDDSIPQSGEGFKWIERAITPTSATNRLVIEAWIDACGGSSSASLIGAFFQDATANAIAVYVAPGIAVATTTSMYLKHEMAAGTTSETTFKFNAGPASGTMYVNGNSGGRKFGGLSAIKMRVTEIKV